MKKTLFLIVMALATVLSASAADIVKYSEIKGLSRQAKEGAKILDSKPQLQLEDVKKAVKLIRQGAQSSRSGADLYLMGLIFGKKGPKGNSFSSFISEEYNKDYRDPEFMPAVGAMFNVTDRESSEIGDYGYPCYDTDLGVMSEEKYLELVEDRYNNRPTLSEYAKNMARMYLRQAAAAGYAAANNVTL